MNAKNALIAICEATAAYSLMAIIGAWLGFATFSSQWTAAGLIAAGLLAAVWLVRVVAGQPSPDHSGEHRTWHRAMIMGLSVLPVAIIITLIAGGQPAVVAVVAVVAVFSATAAAGLIVNLPALRRALARLAANQAGDMNSEEKVGK